MNPSTSCSNCLALDHEGRCRRHPPQVMAEFYETPGDAGGGIRRWTEAPIMRPDDWCLEFVRRLPDAHKMVEMPQGMYVPTMTAFFCTVALIVFGAGGLVWWILK